MQSLALMCAWSPAGSREIVDMLLEAGADASSATQQGATALQLALRAGHDALAQYLVSVLDSVAALNAADLLQWTALHCAAQRISLPAVEMLIKAGPRRCGAQHGCVELLEPCAFCASRWSSPGWLLCMVGAARHAVASCPASRLAAAAVTPCLHVPAVGSPRYRSLQPAACSSCPTARSAAGLNLTCMAGRCGGQREAAGRPHPTAHGRHAAGRGCCGQNAAGSWSRRHARRQ